MPLTLRAISLNDHPLTQPITARFEADGGSIGRADHNTLALPDPERHISRQHAEIRSGSEGYLIRNVGSANPIVVHGQPLGRGESARLGHRDQVRIGGYLLEVTLDDASVAHGAAVAVAAAPAAVAMRRPPPPVGSSDPRTAPGAAASGLVDSKTPLSPGNPFADLLNGAPTSPPPSAAFASVPERAPQQALQPASSLAAAPPPTDPFADLFSSAAGVSSSSAAWAPPPAPVRALLPDDFDPFAMPAPTPPRAVTPQGAAGAFDDLIANGEPASIDQLFGLQPGGRDALADFLADQPARGSDDADTAPGLARVSTDPMALFGISSARPPLGDASPGPADNVPDLRAAFVPPRVQAPPPPPPPPWQALSASLPTAAAGQGDPQALWAAFSAGAGIASDLPQGVTPEQMHVVGSLLRAAVAGTLQLMTVRATTKHELGADVTMIRARNNNPLKFSPDATSALEQLLKPPLRGFLPGPAAMTDAMHDLVGHTIGTMAGTRAALEGVLDRFRPQQLEAKLSDKSVLDSLLPMSRKAKLWELYLQHFDAIRDEAQDDFHALFGRAFLTAYEQQLDRLRQDEHAAPR